MSSLACPTALAAASTTIYGKTAKGRLEVAQRSAGLNARQRTVLIMLDGVRLLTDAAAMVPPTERWPIADTLLRLELIAPLPSADAAVPTMPAPAMAVPAASLAAPQLVAIRRFMAEAARHCLGLLAADLVGRVEQATTASQLLALLGHWHMAMHESKRGKPFVLQHMAQLKASFGGAPCPSIEFVAG